MCVRGRYLNEGQDCRGLSAEKGGKWDDVSGLLCIVSGSSGNDLCNPPGSFQGINSSDIIGNKNLTTGFLVVKEGKTRDRKSL